MDTIATLWDRVEGVLNNATVGAFVGAFAAFMLVVGNDYRRRLRSKRQIRYLVSDNLDLARAKLQTVTDVIDMMRNDNRLSAAPIMAFPTAGLKAKQLEVIDLLDANQNQGLSALLYWMESIDGLLGEHLSMAKRLEEMPRQGQESLARQGIATKILTNLGDARQNLEHLIKMCEWYISGEIARIFETQIPRR
jgi:hypothetical protein